MQQFDHARACFDALVGVTGITSEAREHSGQHDMDDHAAVRYIIGQRWPDLRERDAYAAAARRYDVQLPEAGDAFAELIDAASYALNTRDDAGALSDTAEHNLRAALAFATSETENSHA